MRWQPYFSYGVPVVEVMQSKISFLFKEFFVCEKKIVLFIFISVKKGLDVTVRSSHPEVFLWKGVLKICRKFTGEQPCRSAISITLQSNFIEIALRHGCSPANLLHIFRTLFPGTPLGGCFWTVLSSFLEKPTLVFIFLLIYFIIKRLEYIQDEVRHTVRA